MPNRHERSVLFAITIAVSALATIFVWISINDPVQTAAQGTLKQAIPLQWQLNFPFPASNQQTGLFAFHNYLLAVNVAICAFVLILILFSAYAFRKDRNPVPTTTSHNTALEVTWTVLPVLVLLTIAVPSFKLSAELEQVPNTELTLKITGNQWFWDYSYPDSDDLTFSSVMVPETDLKPDARNLRMLATDRAAVVPIGTNILLLITSNDVIHAWSVPSLGIKRDAIPGKVTAAWVRVDKPGTYYGQCSVLCGLNHPYMPIELKAVTREEFASWIAGQRRGS